MILLSKKILLASGSPRRKQILSDCGFEFECRTKDIPEDFPHELKREQIPLYLAQKKAEAFWEESKEYIVITSDTIVWANGHVMNKPADTDEAKKMLRKLSGNMHEVYTAVCIACDGTYTCFYDRAEVYFRPLTNDEIDYYVKHYKPLDKAGAYGVQEWIGMIGIEKFVGSFYTVMGLPIHLLYEKLLSFKK